MKKEEKYGWYIPDKEFRTQELVSCAWRGAKAGTQGSVERDMAIGYCKERSICLDIGGHIGIFAKEFVNIFEKTIVFEPIDEHYRCILKNLEEADDSLYEVHQVALGGENRDATIYYAYYNTGQSRIVPPDGNIFNYELRRPKAISGEDMSRGELLPTRIVRLDDYIRDDDSLRELCSRKRIDLIKIDVESFEPNVLLGACLTIRGHRPIIMVELLDRCKVLGGYGQNVFAIMKNILNYKFITRSKKNYIFAHESHSAVESKENYVLSNKFCKNWIIHKTLLGEI